jgi:6-phosphogluconolactonase
MQRLVVTTFCLLTSLPLFGQFVYVANVNDNNISGYSVDDATGALIPIPGSPFASGTFPRSVTADPTGRFVYVVNLGDNNVSGYAIDAATGALTSIPGSPFHAGSGPICIALDPQDRFAYVANFSQQSISEYTINAVTGALIPGGSVAGVGSLQSLAVDPAGRFLYSTNAFLPASVTGFTINQSTGALGGIGSFLTGNLPLSVAVDPSGRFAYVANANDKDVSGFTINAAKGTLTSIPGSPFPARSNPVFVAPDPAGRFVYVVNTGSDSISAYTINAATGALATTPESPFPTELRPQSLAVDSTGRFAYGGNGDNTISGYTINAAGGALTPIPGSPFAAGSVPQSIAITPSLNIPFAQFEVRDLHIPCDRDDDDDDRNDIHFRLRGEFTPGRTSKGIDPAHQTVTLGIGNFSLSIPAGMFKADPDDDDFRFRGTINGANVEFEIREEHSRRDNDRDASEFSFRVEVRGVDLGRLPNPVLVRLMIANNTGSAYVKRGRDCQDHHR